MRKRGLSLLLAGVVVLGSANLEFVSEAEQKALPYTDVAENSWYYSYVKNVYDKGLMTGLNKETFAPGDSLVRAQFAVILYRLEGEPEVKENKVSFPDLDQDWYKEAVTWAAGEGIITGYSDSGKFGPNDEITREQMATLMYRYADYKGYDIADSVDFSAYPDAESVTGFAEEAVSWCVADKIITGDNGKINPQGSANRAECATIIDRFDQVTSRQSYVSPEYVKSFVDGTNPKADDYVIMECSWGVTSKSFQAGHIPGAIHINSDDIEEDVNWNIRTPEEIEQFLLKNGITKDTTVICYGSSAGARLAFVCLWAGVENVKLLDGDMNAWKEDGYPIEEGEGKVREAVEEFGTTVPQHPDWVIDEDYILHNALNDNFKLVSIRSYEEYTGQVSGYGYIHKAGEPKGAVWGENTDSYYNEDGTVISLDKANELWAKYGYSSENELAFYCGTGWRACVPWFICYENGVDDMKLYDGGWFVWQKDDERPVQVGDPLNGDVEYKLVGDLPNDAPAKLSK